MTDILTRAQEFETPADALAHYGKKGMKWGVTTAPKRSKPTGREIHDARARLGSQQRQLNNQIDRTNLATGKKQVTEAKKLSEMSTSMLKNPDRATALRLTGGEKFINGLIAVSFPVVGTAAVAGFGTARVVQRKAIESQQRELGVKR